MKAGLILFCKWVSKIPFKQRFLLVNNFLKHRSKLVEEILDTHCKKVGHRLSDSFLFFSLTLFLSETERG